MSEETLENGADFGRLPFDNFISERWNTNAAGDSQEHWERLIWEWQKLTLLERWPYQHLDELTPPKISEEIQRVLATHQTVHERNSSLVSSTGLQTVWLRTCYDPDLESKYKELKRRSMLPGWSGSGNKILDDPTRYDFDDGSEDSWRRVLVRVPGITDYYGLVDMAGDGSDLLYRSGQNDEEMVAQGKESKEVWRDLDLAQFKIQAGLFLLDREAIESALIKILWLDEHGNIAWDNRLDPCTSNLDQLIMALLSATSLVELAGYDGTRGALIMN